MGKVTTAQFSKFWGINKFTSVTFMWKRIDLCFLYSLGKGEEAWTSEAQSIAVVLWNQVSQDEENQKQKVCVQVVIRVCVGSYWWSKFLSVIWKATEVASDMIDQ